MHPYSLIRRVFSFFKMKAPRSKLRGIKPQNPEPSKQLHLDILTMQLLVRLFTALLLHYQTLGLNSLAMYS
jgi:hypothetical protein